MLLEVTGSVLSPTGHSKPKESVAVHNRPRLRRLDTVAIPTAMEPSGQELRL